MSRESDDLLAKFRPDLVGKVELIQEGKIILPPAQGRSFVDRADGFMWLLNRGGDLLLDDPYRWAHYRITEPV